MKTVIIYDSVFGNTAQVAHAMVATLPAAAVLVSQVTPDQLRG